MVSGLGFNTGFNKVQGVYKGLRFRVEGFML